MRLSTTCEYCVTAASSNDARAPGVPFTASVKCATPHGATRFAMSCPPIVLHDGQLQVAEERHDDTEIVQSRHAHGHLVAREKPDVANVDNRRARRRSDRRNVLSQITRGAGTHPPPDRISPHP